MRNFNEYKMKQVALKDIKVGDKIKVPADNGYTLGEVTAVMWCMNDTWISAWVSVNGKHDGAAQGFIDSLRWVATGEEHE